MTRFKLVIYTYAKGQLQDRRERRVTGEEYDSILFEYRERALEETAINVPETDQILIKFTMSYRPLVFYVISVNRKSS